MKIRPLLLLTLTSGLMLGCGDDTPMLISQEQEIQIGQEVAQEVRQEYGAPLTSGQEVARTEAVWSNLQRYTVRDVPYQIQVLNNNETVNAFAAPGGYIYVTRALVNTMNQDNELAFVVAHEIGHVEEEHGRKSINQAVLVNTAASLLLNDQSQLVNFGASVAWTLYAQGYSRNHEREADQVALPLMVKAGYNPWGSISALRKLGGGDLSGPSKWLASHPSTPERIRNLEQTIEQRYSRFAR